MVDLQNSCEHFNEEKTYVIKNDNQNTENETPDNYRSNEVLEDIYEEDENSYYDENYNLSDEDFTDSTDIDVDSHEDIESDRTNNENISEENMSVGSNSKSVFDEEISCNYNQKIFEKSHNYEYAPVGRFISLINTSVVQEPWPNDVKLYQPYEVEQILLPDNANCLAVQAFLRMCQLPYQVESRANAEAMSPTGRVPFIKCGAFVVSELEGIVQFVNNRGITLTDKLNDKEKSDMRAYMCLVHIVLEKAELYLCWLDDETYNDVTSVRHGSVHPWPLNHIQNWSKRRSVLKNLKVWEWHDKTLNEVFADVENACEALSDRLDTRDYFFGKYPTELDALVFGHLFTILTTPLTNNTFADITRKYPTLINLIKRIERKYFKREKTDD